MTKNNERMPAWGAIEVRGAHENNLRDISFDIREDCARLVEIEGVPSTPG